MFRRADDSIWEPLKTHHYDSNNGVHGKYYSIGVYLAAYDSLGALATDVGKFRCQAQLFFKDP